MVWLYGKHAVKSALINKKRKHKKILFAENNSLIEYINDKKITINIEQVTKGKLNSLFPNSLHQNIALETSSILEYNLECLKDNAKKESLIIILDCPSDPQNIGSIIRTAAGFNADAIVIPKHNTVNLENPTIAKVASGGIEHINLITVNNIASTMVALKKLGYWCIGLSETGKIDINKQNIQGKTALVMGAEEKGLRVITQKNCDVLVKLPTFSHFSTLNVANATAIACYEYQCQSTRNN